MAEKITFYYDEEADMLEVSFQTPQETIADEYEKDVFVHYSTKTDTVVSITILNFTKRFTNIRKPFSVLIYDSMYKPPNPDIGWQ
ncbi:DUF2283 domain-containing protein [Candidatus Poribacteria bacterium]|nr:DUF2283 domain-containing protein [Candidatus Poribacteria bacterium]